jgi:ATP-dependent exoDNAse (exonuclease V) beta subunit
VTELWRYRVSTQRKSEAAAAVARGIADLLQDEDSLVRDRVTGETRRAQAGDVAVLCRRHADAVRLAEALEAMGFRSVLGRPGLLETLEARVVMAALRLWVDPTDAFAAAELGRILACPDEPTRWLETLLADPGRAFLDLPQVARLMARRAE